MKLTRRALVIISLCTTLIGACQPTRPSPGAARTATPRPILKVTATALPATPALPISPSEIPAPATWLACSPWSRYHNVCILDFTVTPTQVVAGENMTFTWVATGASTVRLDLYDFYGSSMYSPGLQSWANLPVTGSLTVQMTDTQRGVYRFVLWADPATAGTYVAETVYYNCTDPFFFAPIQPYFGPPCPAGPAVPVQVTQQSFEHGLMIWLNSENGVYILYNRDYFPLGAPMVGWYDVAGEVAAPEGEPDSTPPPGKYRPVHTLGGVWQKYHLLQTLGWALAPEQTFTSLYQLNYPGWPFYLRTAEGRILAVKNHWGPHYDDPSWSYLTP